MKYRFSIFTILPFKIKLESIILYVCGYIMFTHHLTNFDFRYAFTISNKIPLILFSENPTVHNKRSHSNRKNAQKRSRRMQLGGRQRRDDLCQDIRDNVCVKQQRDSGYFYSDFGGIYVTGGMFKSQTGPLACLSPFPVWWWIRSNSCIRLRCF